MPRIVKHHNINIVVLAAGEAVADHCRPDDIAIDGGGDGWWVRFIGAAGRIDNYDAPYASCDEALWAAKAAAEYGLD